MKKIVLYILTLISLMMLVSCSQPSVNVTTPTPGASSPTPEAVQTPELTPTPQPTPIPTPIPTPEPTPAHYVKLSDPSSSLSVRKGPGTNTDILGKLSDGDIVNIIERGDVWHKIEYNGIEAYVFAAYIKGLPVEYAYVPALEATINGKTYVSKMVDVRAVIPDLKIWLTFASQDNVFGKVLYPAGACLLQESTAIKLAKAQELFKQDGYRIRLYDGYRPFSVSEYIWEQVPDTRYSANPNKSPSNHNRGAAVDITLECIDTGEQIPMPSQFHTFNISSFRKLPDISQYEEGSDEYNKILKDYPDILKYYKRSSEGMKNMNYMTNIMKKCGFTTISTEWWHFTDSEKAKFLVLDYNLAKDVQWIAEEDYEAFMTQKEAEGPLTEMPDYVVGK